MGPAFSPRSVPQPGGAVLPGRTVEVWLGSLAPRRDPPGPELSTLSPDESAYAKGMAPEPRRRFTASRILLRRLISAYVGDTPGEIEFSYGSDGKPALGGRHAGSLLHFNLSHSRDRMLFAIGRTPLGIDLETPRRLRNFGAVAERFFAQGEVCALGKLPAAQRQAAFFACWTRKEAYVKAIGHGISNRFKTFEVVFSPGLKPAVLATDGRPDPHYSVLHLEPEPGLVGALVVTGSAETLNYWSIR